MSFLTVARFRFLARLAHAGSGTKWWLPPLLLWAAFDSWTAQAGDNDFVAPALTVTSHANGQIVTTSTVVLQGSATDAGRGGHGISSISARGTVQGATATGDATVNWSQSITLNPGPNYISVYAYDNSTAQNAATATLTINFQPLDTLPPNLVITSHANGTVVNTKTVLLTGTASDAGLGNNGVSSVYLRGPLPETSTTGNGTVNWSREVTLSRGANYIPIYAYDASDVKNERLIEFTINFQPVDPLPPILEITSHKSGQIVTTSTIVIAGTATDAGRGNNGIASVYLQGPLPDVTATGANTATWSRSVDLRPGANYLNIYATDQSDVSNEATVSLTLNYQPEDALAPVLDVTSHTNGQTVFTSTIRLAGTATDAGRGDHGISSVNVRGTLPDVSGTGAQLVTWSKTLELSPGKNYFNIYASDRNQFPNEAAFSLIINFQPADTLGPKLAVTSHTDGQTVTTSTVVIAGTASDAGRGDQGISQVYLRGRIEGATATQGAEVKWNRTVELSPGRNYLSVTAYDDSPFPNETAVNLVLILQPADSTPPALQITSHFDGQVIPTNSLTLRGIATDAGRGDHGISAVRVNSVRADNDTASGAATANWSRTFALNPGRNQIYVTAQDGSQFPQETNLAFVVIYQTGDVTPPDLTIDQPRNNITVGTASILVSGTTTDAGRGDNGVASVTVNGVAALGGAVTGSTTGAWSRNVPLARGANVISIVVEDGSPSRNSAAQTVTVNYEPTDLVPPLIAITSHRNGATVTTAAITLAGTATDDGRGNSGITSVTINGTRAAADTATGAATAVWTRVVNLALGPNVISAVARDGNQNDAAQALTIIYDPVDTTPPDLVVTSHRKGQIVTKPTILLAGTASDARLGDQGILDVTVNSSPAAGGSATGAATAQWTRSVNLQVGPNLLSIVARDNSPNHNPAALTLDLIYEPVDQTPPELVVTSHRNGQTVLGNTIILSGTATDRDLGDSGVASVSVNGVPATGAVTGGGATAQWSRPITLALGENVISVVAIDGSPRQNSAAVTLTLIYDPKLVASSAEFCWAAAGGSATSAAGYGVALDAGGHSFVTGSFAGGATFGGTNLVSRGAADIFVAKYDGDGQLLWARQAGGSNGDVGLGVAVDGTGACYVTGYFSGTADFGGVTLRTTGTYDLFLAKYDPEGRLLWATNTGTSIGAFGRAVAVDSQGNSYLTGGFKYDAQFGGETFANNEFSDAFVARYGPTGQLLWALQLGGEAEDVGTGIGVDPRGGCYVTGTFSDEGYFEDEVLTSFGEVDTFVAHLSPDGELAWVDQAGDTGKTEATGLSVDPKGNCLVTGHLDQSATFGTNDLQSVGFYDLFLAKYDPSGDVRWARNSQLSYAISAAGVGTDLTGRAYVAGSFYGTADFGVRQLTNGATAQIFVAQYDGDGNFIGATQAGGPVDDFGSAIAVGATGGYVITGTSTGRTTLGSRILEGGTTPDMIIGRVSASGVSSPISLRIQWLSPSQLQLQFTGEACTTYRLQGSVDLREWLTVPIADPVNDIRTHVEDLNGANPHRFFRVVSP